MANQNFDTESYVNNFLSANKLELMNISYENGFSFLEEELVFIQSHLRDQKKALPTYNQLNFFNEISKIRQKEKMNCAISSVSADTSDSSIIFETAKDLLQKKNLCQEKLFGPTPLYFSALTASKYLKYIDCAEPFCFFTPSYKATQSNYYIHTDKNAPLFSLTDADLSKKEDQPLSKSAITILSPRYEMSDEEYNSKAQDFLMSYSAQTYITNYKTISGAFGLLGALSNETEGILVNLSNIPETKKDENGYVCDLTELLSVCCGRYIFDLDPVHGLTLDHIASEYGLLINIFAIRDQSKLFTLVKAKNPAFCFKTDFLFELINFKDNKAYIFSSEKNEAIGSKNPVFLTNVKPDGNHTYSAEKILVFTKIIANATSRKLTNSPYKTSSIAVLDAINALVAKGVSKDTITLSIHYTLLSQTDDQHELGKNFAAILGSYRTMIELCVSDSEPQISYDPTKRNITVIASAKPPIKKTKNIFADTESFIYFLPIQYDNYGIPDYDQYRYMLKYFYLLFENDTILSSFPVNENISSIIFNAAQKSNISFSEDIYSDTMSSSHGILFETYKELPSEKSLIFIGKSIPFSTTKE